MFECNAVVDHETLRGMLLCCYVVVHNTTYSLAALDHYYFAALTLGEYVVFVLSVGKTQAFPLYIRDAEVDELGRIAHRRRIAVIARRVTANLLRSQTRIRVVRQYSSRLLMHLCMYIYSQPNM